MLADIPYGNGVWAYDATKYSSTGKASDPVAGYFLTQLDQYNFPNGHDGQPNSTGPISQVFAYGGDVELYCQGSGGSAPGSACLPKSFLLVYYPPFLFNGSTNNWDFWQNSLGDSGFRSVTDYKRLTYYNPTDNKIEPAQAIADIDGRVDMAHTNDDDTNQDYLNSLNILSKTDASRFADVVAKGICADDNIDGVQFDIEPFSFTGGTSTDPNKPPLKGDGQKYFYEEIAKDFAGHYDDSAVKDPLHCVDTAHPNGRIFSVFTFADKVTPDVEQVFNKYHNGYVVDSLYDLGTDTNPDQPTWHDLATFDKLAIDEIKKMATKNVPYQFAIPAAASVHEYESSTMTNKGIGKGNQYAYVLGALSAIKQYGLTPNFKGIDVWSYNKEMWWHGYKFEPAYPQGQTIIELQQGLGWNLKR